MKEIEKHLQSYLGIPEKEVEKISSYFNLVEMERDTYLIKSGKYNPGLSFVQQGYLRIFTIDEASGKEITQWISCPGTFVTDAAALFFDGPARWDIQAVSDCKLLSISQENFKKIGDHISNWPHLEKLFLAKCFMTLEDRVFSHLSLSSEDRYKMFFQYNPELFNNVPLQYIASMLGMTPETFSRIRKKLSS